MVMVRFGTCGTLQKDVPIGSICTSNAAGIFPATATFKIIALLAQSLIRTPPPLVSVLRNPDAFRSGDSSLPRYLISKPVAAHKNLHDAVFSKVKNTWQSVYEGMDATADSFYSSQGMQCLVLVFFFFFPFFH